MVNLTSTYSKELLDVGPDIVVKHLERELRVERHDLCAVALAPADVGVAVLNTEEERDGRKAGGGSSAMSDTTSELLLSTTAQARRV